MFFIVDQVPNTGLGKTKMKLYFIPIKQLGKW